MPCRSGEFVCTKSTQCVELVDVCDGFPDCDDNSDEEEGCRLSFTISTEPVEADFSQQSTQGLENFDSSQS